MYIFYALNLFKTIEERNSQNPKSTLETKAKTMYGGENIWITYFFHIGGYCFF